MQPPFNYSVFSLNGMPGGECPFLDPFSQDVLADSRVTSLYCLYGFTRSPASFFSYEVFFPLVLFWKVDLGLSSRLRFFF